MSDSKNTNWSKSVAGIVIHDNKVLLVRHTYGTGKGKLIIPGGYINHEESPQDAVKREVLEETGVSVIPTDIVGIRFNTKDWYVIFKANYIGGTAQSDGKENSEAVWMGIDEALLRDDVTELTKTLIQEMLEGKKLKEVPYDGNIKYAPHSLYC